MNEEIKKKIEEDTPLWFSLSAICVGFGLLYYLSYEWTEGVLILSKKMGVEFSRSTNPLGFWVGLFIQATIGVCVVGEFSSRFWKKLNER